MNLFSTLITIIFASAGTGELLASTDTVFLQRGMTSSVFIDPGRNPKTYARIRSFNTLRLDPHEDELVREALFLCDSQNLKKNTLYDLPRNWRPLYLYGDSFYVYAPSDWGNNVIVYFSDSLYYINIWDTYAYRLDSFEKLKPALYSFKARNCYENLESTTIHIIDSLRGIAVFENGGLFHLLVDARKVELFPLIVNYSPHAKAIEYKFAAPDFKKLLKD